MPAPLLVLRLVVALGLSAGVALAYFEPRWPLLGYWLLFSVALGIAVSMMPGFTSAAMCPFEIPLSRYIRSMEPYFS